ncbi:MAG: acetyl-CoA carboxylase biotin carboxyl carrier protein subunit [Terrimicrobiaceae bacterium]|nr:acetyl-CoA carboxylase biotin carboxyl carrier protein subunit [Terrimicrobiaceae bacterium]
MTKRLRITINGERFEVTAEVLDEGGLSAPAPAAPVASSAPVLAAPPQPASPANGGGATVVSPMSGKLVSYSVKVGDEVAIGDQLAIVEAMKMNTYVMAETGGTVQELLANPGEGVEEGQAILVVKQTA